MTNNTLAKSDLTGNLYLLAGRMDAQSRLLAKKLHELGHLYVLFGALDGLSLSYSMIKYSFDMMLADNPLSSSDDMHDWMVTPEGAVAAATTSISLIVFSMLANHFDDEDQNLIKRYIAILWPYCRDIMKGLKNSYKGFKSTLQIVELLGGVDLKHLIVPVGLVLGGLSVINRIWFRWMVTKRKEMMKANARLLDEIQNSSEITLENLEHLLAHVQEQSIAIRTMALLSAAYGGVIDGLYQYIGVLSVCSLMPPALIAMTVFCALYFVACIATRMYEEYDFQRKLLISKTKIELAYEGKKVELLFIKLQNLSSQLAYDSENDSLILEQDEAISLFELALSGFKARQDHLHSLSTLSYASAFLAGARNGLAAYGALASMIFAIGMVLSLASVPFPPALLISCIVIGMTLLIGFIAHAVIYNYRHLAHEQQQSEEMTTPHQALELAEIRVLFKSARQEVKDLKPELVRTAIHDGMVVDSSQQSSFPEFFEVLRSFFSGMNKGSKAIDLTMNPLEEKLDTDGHYHESPVMIVFIMASSIIHALVLALRALARGFGRPPIDALPVSSDVEIELETFSSSEEDDDLEEELSQPIAESGCNKQVSPESLGHSTFSFFYNPNSSRSIPKPIGSLPFIPQIDCKPAYSEFKSINPSMTEIIPDGRAEDLGLGHYTF